MIELFLVVQIKLALLCHDEHAVVSLIADKIVLHVFEHHVEAILDVVFSAAGHFLDDLRPLVADTESPFQNKNVLFQRERIFLDLRIQKVDPALSALLTISV